MIRICPKCGIPKELSQYDKAKDRALGVKGCCRPCKAIHRNKLHRDNPVPLMWNAAKLRAKRQSVLFTITQSDISVPKLCPILGIPLAVHAGKGGGPNSPSLDKIIPEQGYTPGNVQVISSLANAMKNHATLEQMVRLGKWASKQLKLQTIAS
jgi:hypothetical protein